MNGERSLGSRWLLPRLLSVMAIVAGVVVVADTTFQSGSASAAAISVGTLSAQVTDHVGTTQGGATTGSGNNCVRYSPTNTSNSSAFVTSPNEAIAAHGFPSNGNCPQALDITKQSAVGVRPAVGGSVVDGTPFLLGRVVHYNNPISSATDQFFTGKLAVKLSAFDGAPTVGFDWWMWETPNNASPCPGTTSNTGCDDEIKFTNQISTTTLTQGGITYRLVVNGFEPVGTSTTCPAAPTGTSQNDFWTKEQAQTHACLYATLVQVRKVTVVKTIVGATGVTTAPSRTFDYTGSGSLAGSPWTGKSFSLTPPANGSASSAPTEIVRGDTANIIETNPNDDRWSLTGLACTDFDANGNTRALPAGATYNLGTRTITLANVPAPASNAKPDITCTYTNTYTPKATLTLVKVVSGGSATVSNFTLTAKGAAAAPVSGAQISGISGNTAVTAQRVPAGSYTLSESGPAGYLSDAGWVCSSTSNTGTALTLADGANVTCTITNRYQTGSLKIVKALDDPKGGVSSPATRSFTGKYTCGTANPVNFSVTTATPFVAANIPAGVNCTVTEDQPTGGLLNGSFSWGNPTYSTQPVTITDNGTATVTVTNHVTQNTGTFTVVKAIAGPGGYSGGSGRLFPVSYSCAIGSTVTATGNLSISTAGAVSASGPIPVSSVCTFNETLTAKPGDFTDASYEWTTTTVTPSTITIAAGTPVAVTITNTYARQFGSLQISKLVSGSGYNGGSVKNFTVGYDCGAGFIGSVTIANNGSVTVPNLPAGATCTLTETAPADSLLSAAYDWGTPTWSTNNTPVIVKGQAVSRTVTNPTVAVFGKVSVTKVVTGTTSGLLAGTTFHVTAACGTAGTTSFDLVVGVAQSTGNLPVGTACDITETAPAGGLVDSSYAWGATPGSQHVVIATSNTTVPVTVTNTINRVRGAFTITKVVQAPAGVVAPGRSFAGTYSCTYGNDPAVAGSWNLQNGAIVTVDSILLGSVCEVKENAAALAAPPSATDPSFVWAGVPAPQSVTIASSTTKPGVTVTNVVNRLSGSLGVAKIVAGSGKAGGYVPGSSFPFDYSCAPALDGPSVSGSFSLADGAGWSGPSLPAGATCTLTEGSNPATTGPDYSWDGVVFSGTVAVNQNGRSATFTTPLLGVPVQITATNTITRTTGPIYVTKVVTGETAGLLPGTAFDVTLVCSDQVARSAQVTNGLAYKFTGIPVNVTCTASETLPTAPLLDASFAWGAPTYSPLTAVGVDGTITVSNPITRVVAPVSLTKSFSGPQGVVSVGKVYSGTWACTYRATQVAGGNWSVTAGQTVQLAASVPLTSVCTATEAALGTPSADPSYRWLAPTVTPAVVGGASNVVTVANTLTRDTGTITVGKLLSGDTAGYTGTGAAFTVRYDCAVVGQPGIVPLQNSITVAANGTAQIAGVPLGWACHLTEDSPSSSLLADGSFAWGTPSIDLPTVTLSAGTPAATVTVTNPIHRVFGTLQVVKSVVDGFGAVLPTAAFSGSYRCTYGPDGAVTGTWNVAGAAGGTASVSTPFLIGSVCTVSENTPSAGDLQNASYAWNDPVLGAPVTIAGPAPVSLTVKNEVHRLYGGLTVTKTVIDPAQGVKPTAVFDGAWSCSLAGAADISGRFHVTAGGTVTLFSPADAVVPAASTCSIVEDTPDPALLVDGSFAWATPTYNPANVVLVDGRMVGLGVTNSVTRVSSSLTISKSVTGPAAGLVDTTRIYGGTVECTYRNDQPVVRSWEASTITPAVVDGILVGSTCVVSEAMESISAPPVAGDPSYVWGTPSVTPLSAVIAAPTDAVATVKVENPTARRTGSFSLDKTVTGATDGIVGPAPMYHFTYVCTPATGAPLSGSFQVAANDTWTSDVAIPVGSTCRVTEPADSLPTLVDSAWSWDPPTFVVDGAIGTPSDRGVDFTVPVNGETAVAVHATNNVSRAFGSYTISKTSNPPSGSTVTPGSTVTYTVTVTSTGEVPVHDVFVTDDLSGVANHAVIGPVFAVDQGTVEYDQTAGTLTWSVGDIAAGATLTLSYTAVIDTDAKNVVVHNSVTAIGDVPPSTCEEPEAVCTTEHFTPEWTVAKASDPATGSVVVPGQTITYTLTAFNLSTKAVAAGIVVSDNLADVLDDGSLLTDLAPLGAHLTGTTLTWNVGTLAPGASATLTYQVKLDADAFGASIVNVITADGATDPDNCAVGVTSTQGCSTTHRTPLAPRIVKRLVGEPVVASDGVTSTVKYAIVVTNPNASDVVSYNLSDTLGFPAGATISSAKVTSSPAGVTVNAGWNGAGVSTIATAASLAGGATHTYEITVVALVPAAVADSLRACTDAPGHGFFNGATLVAFGSTTAVSACAVVAPSQESGGPVPPTTVPPTTVPPTTVPPTTTRPSGSLPTTGAEMMGMLQLAALPIGLGLLLLALRRRRRPA